VNRVTKKTIGCFQYTLKDHKPITGEFNNYDSFFNYNMAVKRLGELEESLEPKSIDEWNEGFGDVLWWKFPIEEPPYVGTPLDLSWPDYHTYWTPITIPDQPKQYEDTEQ